MVGRQEKAPMGPYMDANNQTKYRYQWSDGHADLKWVCSILAAVVWGSCLVALPCVC